MAGNEEMTRPGYLRSVNERLSGWADKVEALAEEVGTTRQLKSAMQEPVAQRVEPKLEALRDSVRALATADADSWEVMQEPVEKAEAELAAAYEAVTEAFDVK